MEVFKPQDPSKALYHVKETGPLFNNALGIGSFTPPMNKTDAGNCLTDGSEYDYVKYCVPKDKKGRNVLTGSTNGDFTCEKLEVYLIE